MPKLEATDEFTAKLRSLIAVVLSENHTLEDRAWPLTHIGQS